MNNNILKKTVYLVGISITIYLTIYIYLDNLNSTNAASFTKSLFGLISNSLLFLFLSFLIYFLLFKKKNLNGNLLKSLGFGFVSMIVFVIITNFLVNPRGIYGPSFFPTLVTNMRNKKVNDFNNLDESPDLVIIGSSRALSINPDYVEKKTGLSTYNFGVTGTYLDEYLVILRYIFDQEKTNPPKVILIDRLGFSVNPSMTAARAPFQFFPYIEKENRSEILANRLSNLIDLHQLTESLYVLQFFMSDQDYQPVWTVSKNGFGVPRFEENLEEAMETSLADRIDRVPCDNFYPEKGIPIIEEMVALAAQHHSILIFYTSPNQPDYLTRLKDQEENQDAKSSNEATCGQEVSNFYAQVEESNQHVYSVLFSSPEEFGGFTDEQGYYDGTHMTQANSILLIDALSATIINAYQEVIQQRNSINNP